MDTTVVDVPERGRFEIRVGDRVVGLASYHVDDGTMTLPHTEVDPGMGGRGLGTTLVAGVLEPPASAACTCFPTAPSCATTSSSTPSDIDLVAEADREHFGLGTADR